MTPRNCEVFRDEDETGREILFLSPRLLDVDFLESENERRDKVSKLWNGRKFD